MFTGIVEETGSVRRLQPRGSVLLAEVAAQLTLEDLRPGASIAVDGCCLTAVAVEAHAFTCELTAETLARTGFEERLKPGTRVNLERPLRADGRFDGHIVQGHVDGTGRVVELRRAGTAAELRVEAPP